MTMLQTIDRPVRHAPHAWGISTIRCDSLSIARSGKPRSGDAFVVAGPVPFYAIADGIGSLAEGDRSAGEALVRLQQQIVAGLKGPTSPTREACDSVLREALAATNGWLLSRAYRPGAMQAARVGCCIAGILFVPDGSYRALVFHAGDVRVYGALSERPRRLTEDHVEPQRSAGKSRSEPRVLQGLGLQARPEFAVRSIDIAPSDGLFVTSDGILRCIGEDGFDDAIADTEASPADRLRALAGRLDPAAIRDDVTMLALSID